MFDIFKGQRGLTLFATILLVFYGIYYMPIDSFAMNAPIKMALMVSSIFVLLFYSLKASKALIIGVIYLIYQYIVASFHPESFRWNTYIYSILLVLTYVSFYNLVFIEKVFKIEHFIRICKWFITLYFIFCVIQQVLIIMGITYMPILNLMLSLDRGLGCQSLSMEPSTFGRFMLVFYYAYVKCQEYKRDEGPFTLSELFSGEHKWVSIMFLWMMTTMGSGTAYVCLILFSLYFVRWHNWYYIVPFIIIGYITIQASGFEQLDRATSVINATTTLEKENIQEADGSAAARISPIINSLNADFSKKETWFGYGIDYGRDHNTFVRQTGTLFDDYGFIFYLISLLFAFSCAYNFWSLGCIFMFAGIAGGMGNNIQYAWELAMVMTCVRYFYENRYNPIIYEENNDEELEDEGTRTDLTLS
ncbi:MAG: hypothetical protein IKL56_04255 [Bacteroidaceae bacterium]|nr:hypothetical protein [Bacteroidaceae bacterium]